MAPTPLRDDIRVLVADAMARLPRAGPDSPLQVIELGLRHPRAQYRITLESCRNPLPSIHVWFWGIKKVERVDTGCGTDRQVDPSG
jgi:hypothetical protein